MVDQSQSEGRPQITPLSTAAGTVQQRPAPGPSSRSSHDTKDLQFGMGLSATRRGEPMRRDRLLLISASATALLRLLGAVGETLGIDRLLYPMRPPCARRMVNSAASTPTAYLAQSIGRLNCKGFRLRLAATSQPWATHCVLFGRRMTNASRTIRASALNHGLLVGILRIPTKPATGRAGTLRRRV